jgi:hypothetical protein
MNRTRDMSLVRAVASLLDNPIDQLAMMLAALNDDSSDTLHRLETVAASLPHVLDLTPEQREKAKAMVGARINDLRAARIANMRKRTKRARRASTT